MENEIQIKEIRGDPKHKCQKCGETIHHKTQKTLIKEGEKKNISFWIMSILEILILIIIIFAWTKGKFIDNTYEIIEICEGKPTDPNTNLILNEQKEIIDIYKNEKSLTGKTKIEGETPWQNN